MSIDSKLDEIIDLLERVDDDADPYDLILARENNDSSESRFEFGRAVTVGKLPRRLGDFVESQIKNVRKQIAKDDLTPTEYDAANIANYKDLVQEVDSDSIPHFEEYRKMIDTHEFKSLDYLSEQGNKPDFQAILIRDGTEERLWAFQNLTAGSILAKEGKIRVWVEDEYYKEVEDDILEIPSQIDALYYNGDLIIFNQPAFEKIFNYREQFEQAVESTVESIVDSDVPIHTDERFREAILSYPNAPRLFYQVKDLEIWEEESVNIEVFKNIIDEFDLDLSVETRSGQRGIVMESKTLVWQTIHLYNDDYLESPITEYAYLVDGKNSRVE